MTTSEALDRSWAAVRTAAEGARGRLMRLDDALGRLAADAAGAAPVRLDWSAAELAAIMEAVRARARRASAGADDGAGLLAAVTARGPAWVAAAETGLAVRGRELPLAVTARVERASASLDALAAQMSSNARLRLGRADDGGRVLTAIAAAVAEVHRHGEAAVDRHMRAVEAAAARRIEGSSVALDRHAALLDDAEPAHVLRRGYALVTDGSGQPVTSAAAARAAVALHLTFDDGSLAVRLAPPQTITGETP